MIDWLRDTIPIFKAFHIAALCIWCGGLLALPLMLSRHDPAVAQDDYRRIRRATHLTYTTCVTPAAVVAVVAGTWLIFLREAFVPWLYAKLLFVALLVAAHAWIGHIMVEVAETPGRDTPPRPLLPVVAILLPVLAILVLVLGKPDLDWIELPQWLREPHGGHFPFDVPRR
ncbi:CopD family protein [Roseitranquillus sediminis]|uniref:CopD family protein n=1 Tax=Roseitranquillus sediminis TaxID=2809051 RepID=UPI001D0CD0AB|nr:CopD family protein [Roseitranquillus sediminis]MBM9593404.1 CopD family protein [Roseitranquillus sediminis]